MARRTTLDLSGAWRAAPTSADDLRQRYADEALDDGDWETVPVPGHWRSTEAFAHHDGPLAYRTRFDSATARPRADERSFLVLDGVMATADVWLDGTYLGDTAGYAVPHWFEVTGLLRDRDEHLLALEVGNDPVGTGRVRDLTGAFGRSALLGSGHNPGGIWRPVRLHTTGPVRVRHCRLRCPQADADRATLSVRVVLDNDEPRAVTLRTWVARAIDTVHLDDAPLPTTDDEPTTEVALERAVVVIEREHPLATGENRIELTVPVPDPELWWPHALGDQPLYDVGLDVLVDDQVSDAHRWRTGLRQVRMDDFVATVNGERLFLKGVSVGPTRELLAEATAEEVAADIRRAADAGLDLVRVHGHIARTELYDEADRLGVLLWQDLPIQWALQRQAKASARHLARHAVDELAHHPSLLVWCAHHEPWGGDPRTGRRGTPRDVRAARLRWLTAQVLPSWNRTMLDRSVAETLATSDRSRPVLAHSGVWPHLPQLSGTSTHLWAGWRWGRTSDLARLLRWWPRLGRFVAEFGAQAPSGDGRLLDIDGDAAERWPDLDWPTLADRYALELGPVRHQVPPDHHGSLADWTAAAQAHQAEVVRRHVETLRRLKYRPTGGFAAFALADPAPGATAALLSHDRTPKPAWDAFVEACAPVVAVLDELPDRLRTDDRVRLDLHVVNDRRVPIEGLRAIVTAAWEGHEREPFHRVGWEGSVTADAVHRIGVVELTVPEPPPDAPPHGPTVVVTVELSADGRVLGRRSARRTLHR
jgi:beta-mannosidase